MKQVLLGDVCEINPKADSGIGDDVECSFVPMEYVDDISGTIAQTEDRLFRDVKKGYTFFKNDDVIFAKITPCMENGKCAIGRNLKNGIAFGSTEFHVIRAKEEIIPEWIYYYLRQEHIRQSATHWFRGTAGQQRVPAIFLEELKIPLPPLEEQKRIASLLARADRLRGLRRAAREQCDSLLQSVFLEMFGDVVKNEKGFDVFPFEELSTRITKGESPNWQGFSYENNGVSFITSENVLWGKLDISNPKYISEKFHTKLKRSQLTENDLLINLVGASIGRATLVTSDALPANINQAVATISMDTAKLNPYFVLYQILNPYKQNQLLGNIVESARANISLTNISELNLIVPPLALQEEFARVVARVEALRARMDESARQAEGLFQSLLAESFG